MSDHFDIHLWDFESGRHPGEDDSLGEVCAVDGGARHSATIEHANEHGELHPDYNPGGAPYVLTADERADVKAAYAQAARDRVLLNPLARR